MEQRFKLTADNVVHIEDGTHGYTDTLDNALTDIATSGITITPPDLTSVSGAVAVVGFEISDSKKEFILENGWHYPMTTAQAADYQQYVDCISGVVAVKTAQDERLAPLEPEVVEA